MNFAMTTLTVTLCSLSGIRYSNDNNLGADTANRNDVFELSRGLQSLLSGFAILMSLQSQLPCLFSNNTVTGNNSLQGLSRVLCDYSYMMKLFSHLECNDFEKNGKV